MVINNSKIFKVKKRTITNNRSSTTKKASAIAILTFMLLASFVALVYAKPYTFITKFGTYGTGDGQFHLPSGVDVDSDGNVYVADPFNDRVQKFSNDGTFITKWGSFGSGDGQFKNPDGITVDGDGNVYVVDSHVWNVQKFSSDGAFITKWGSQGSGDG